MNFTSPLVSYYDIVLPMHFGATVNMDKEQCSERMTVTIPHTSGSTSPLIEVGTSPYQPTFPTDNE